MFRIGRWAVVAVWVGLLLALGRSQWPRHETSAPAPLPPVVDVAAVDDAWMGVYMRAAKIGYSHGRVSPVADGYRLEESSYLRLSVLDQVQTVRVVTDATTTPDFALRSFTIALDSGLGVFDVQGSVEEGTLILRMGSSGAGTEQRISLREPLYLPSSARATARSTSCSPGPTT